VAEVTVRVLPFAVADGPHNMAADETLLNAAVAGRASLRFYGWSAATLSLGYFQPAAVRQQLSPLSGLPYVRRASGGATLVHHLEVTYCLALPDKLAGRGALPWLRRMHKIVVTALREFNVRADLHEGEEIKRSPVLCFMDLTPGDVILDGMKIVGSAQRRRHGALLQHGAILLGQSPFTPELPGVREKAGVAIGPARCIEAVSHAFTDDLHWSVRNEDWTLEERRAIEELAVAKYACPEWTNRR
jgi:lipoate-protein ligase A